MRNDYIACNNQKVTFAELRMLYVAMLLLVSVQRCWHYSVGLKGTLREKIMPARGPLKDLCVVVVTTSQ